MKRIGTIACAAVVAATLGAPAAAAPTAPDIADGFLVGQPHQMRIRAVLGRVPKAVAHVRLTAKQSAASSDAIAACDPARVRSLRAVPTTKRAQDTPGSCVVLGGYLLAPATVTGTDIHQVKVRHAKKGSYSVALELTDFGTTAFAALTQERMHQKVTITLDGSVLSAVTVGPDYAALVATGGLVAASGSRGLSFSGAYSLASRYQQAEVEQLVGFAGDTTMTDPARRSLGESDPQLDDKAQFAVDCRVPEAAGSLVLGCYTRKTVYVLRVDRPDLANVMPVTTAHEMLHAAYGRLPTAERRRVNALIEDFYRTLDDPELTELVADYERVEPGQRLNELHSLLPTEVRTLSPELEHYYRRYFRDRARVVDAFDSYNVVFSSVRSRLDGLEAEINGLKAQLDDLKPRLDDASMRADELGNQIDALRAQGRIGESNNLVGPQNAAVNEGNALVDEYNAIVEQYNAKVQEINMVSQDELGLYNSISAVPLQPQTG